MRLLKIALFLCAVTGLLEGTLAQTNDCVGPPPSYTDSTFDHCVPNQPTGGCNCNASAQTCSFGDQLHYTCNHGTGLDFIIVCDYKDGLGNFGFISLIALKDEFEDCTGSPPPVASTPPPAQTFPPSVCSKFNVATWPPEGCIKLVGSQTMSHETTGILQVYFNNTWGSVCLTSNWNQPTLVDIACRMLGFNSYGSFSALQASIHDLPAGLSNDAWRVNIQHTCPGTVASLWDCDRAAAEPCWLTYFTGGSGECPNLLKISCEVNTTFTNLTSCPPPTTTTPNPTTSGPDTSTHHIEDSTSDEEHTTASGHESSPTAGLSSGGIAGIVAGVIAVLLLVAVGFCMYKRKQNRQGQTEQPRVEKAQPRDDNPTTNESAQELRRLSEDSNGRRSKQTSTERDSVQFLRKQSGADVNPEEKPENLDSDPSTSDPSASMAGQQEVTLPGEAMSINT